MNSKHENVSLIATWLKKFSGTIKWRFTIFNRGSYPRNKIRSFFFNHHNHHNQNKTPDYTQLQTNNYFQFKTTLASNPICDADFHLSNTMFSIYAHCQTILFSLKIVNIIKKSTNKIKNAVKFLRIQNKWFMREHQNGFPLYGLFNFVKKIENHSLPSNPVGICKYQH